MRSPLKARGRVLLNLGARGTRIAHVVRGKLISFSGPEGYAQDPRGRIGLRFVWEYYVHSLFYYLRLGAEMPKALNLKG